MLRHTHHLPTRSTPRGFTLIELAVVLVILALLVGGMAVPLAKRVETQAYAQTQARLDKAMEALIGFAILNGRFPCPSAGAQGAELVPSAVGSQWICGTVPATQSDDSSKSTHISWGDLPWATLGLSPLDGADAWNYRLRYAIRTKLAAGASGASLLTATTLSENGIGIFNPAVGAPVIRPDTNAAVLVVYSLGKNNAGGMLIGGTSEAVYVAKAAPTSSRELANLPNHSTKTVAQTTATPSAANMATTRNIFAMQTHSTEAATYFDDVLVWLSPTLLISKLVAANRYEP